MCGQEIVLTAYGKLAHHNLLGSWKRAALSDLEDEMSELVSMLGAETISAPTRCDGSGQ